MKKIAILVSGEGTSAERIVKLFNEGNRLRTEVVIVDDSGIDLLERLKDRDVTLVHITDAQWLSKSEEVAELLKEKEIDLTVLDNFALVIPDEIMEATNGEILRVTSPELAPREVVNALEADLRKPVEEERKETEELEPTTSTPESEWADTLKIQFTPPKVPTTPPELPHSEPTYEKNPYREIRNTENRQERPGPIEPMPSTYLIWSILVAVFCCFIPGIIAIIFSSMVSSKYYTGDYEGARRASRNAEAWIIVSVVLGIVAATLYIPFMIIGN